MESYVFDVSPGTRRIILPESFKARCPRCGKTRSLREFGLRNMGDGDVRVQSRCTPCRKLKEERDAKVEG